jgi:hypothetical protein
VVSVEPCRAVSAGGCESKQAGKEREAGMKYIKTDKGFYLFPNWVEHGHMARIVGHCVRSAGFVDFQDSRVACHGKAVSLNICPAKDDSEELKRQIEFEP